MVRARLAHNIIPIYIKIHTSRTAKISQQKNMNNENNLAVSININMPADLLPQPVSKRKDV